MKILCIGDSMSLPREGCVYEDTWMGMLRQALPEQTFLGQSRGGRLIGSALEDYVNCYKHYNADLVILQLGVCDCAPRYVNDNKTINAMMRRLFSSLGLSKLYWKIVKSHPRNPNCVYTKPKAFASAYESLIESIIQSGARVIIIKIGHCADSVLKSSPFFNSNVDRYNAMIDGIAEKHKGIVYVVDPLNSVSEEMFVDGYHCDAEGMRVVSSGLRKALEICGVK